MITKVYFIRHCEPNYNNHNDFQRELTDRGLQDRQLILDYFDKKEIDLIFSSPYKRAYDTVLPLAEKHGLSIETIDDFRERKIDNVWIENFTEFSKNQWNDFSYKLSDGESLQEVQDRNIHALNTVVNNHKDKSIVVGSHGTALSTIVNFFVKSFGHEDFNSLKHLMPFVAEFTFQDTICKDIIIFDLFTQQPIKTYTY